MISIKICSRLSFVYEWYPKEGDHFNIILKDIYRRKLFTRIHKFLSIEALKIVDNNLDEALLSKIANQGIKVNVTKPSNEVNLDISSGNFNFKNNKEENNNTSLIRSNIYKKNGSKYNEGRKVSGFSFLDNSLINMSNDEIIDDDERDSIDKNDINNKTDDIDDQNKYEDLDIINENNEFDEKNSKKETIVCPDEEGDIIEVVSSVVSNNNLKDDTSENENNCIQIINKGSLINDSFGFDELNCNKNKSINNDMSFGK